MGESLVQRPRAPEHVAISTMTTEVVIVEIVDSARKHGVADGDILHAFTNAIRVHALDGT